MAFGKKKKEIDKLRFALFRERLKAIELSAPAGAGLGPDEWNISRGQADFLGLSRAGEYKDHYVVIEVNDLPSGGINREKSADWIDLPEEELLSRATGYWVDFLRIDDSQSWRPSSQSERTFGNLQALQEYLHPMNIDWYPAVQAANMLDGVGFYSPDWRSGAVPLDAEGSY